MTTPNSNLIDDRRCNTYAKTGLRCELSRGHDGDHEYGPVRVELPKPMVQGFDRMFATIEKSNAESAYADLLHRFTVLSADFDGERKAWSHERQELQSEIAMLRGTLAGAANEAHLVLETLKAQRDRGVMVIPPEREPWRKKACEGGGTLTNCADNFHECLYCGRKVAADLVDHAFFGFASVCPEKPEVAK